MKQLLPVALAAALVACAGTTAQRRPSPSDPSNPNALEAPPAPPPEALAHRAPSPVPEEEEPAPAPHHVHGQAHEHAAANAAEAGPVYTCPMHPEVTQPGPGRCPKCNMKLVPRSAEEAKP